MSKASRFSSDDIWKNNVEKIVCFRDKLGTNAMKCHLGNFTNNDTRTPNYSR